MAASDETRGSPRLATESAPETATGWKAALALVFTSLLVAALISELVLRMMGIGFGTAHLASSTLLHHQHPPGHSFVSYHPSGEYGGHTVDFDDAGRRTMPPIAGAVVSGGSAAPPPRASVALMGDSFVEAMQVAYEDSFAGLLQAASSDVTVFNYGTSSYSPLLYLLQWQHVVAATSPTYVIVMLYGNDVRDDAQMTALGRRDEQGNIIAVPGPPNGALARLARRSYLLRFLQKTRKQLEWAWQHRNEPRDAALAGVIEENPDISELTAGYLTDLVAGVRSTGAEIVLTAVPSKERTVDPGRRRDGPSFSDKVEAWAAAHDVRFIDLESSFFAADGEPLFFARDIHFNETGHRVAAQALIAALPEAFAAAR